MAVVGLDLAGSIFSFTLDTSEDVMVPPFIGLSVLLYLYEIEMVELYRNLSVMYPVCF